MSTVRAVLLLKKANFQILANVFYRLAETTAGTAGAN
jgi:hypothetical protein